jgi:phosphoribosylformimino-5-aminoimidazole carboxamide ribotide isomerase
LIPSIDLMGGRVVQLERGERLALAFDDLDAWVSRFSVFPIVQLVDLDAARGTGTNRRLVTRILRKLRCQVGGGLRTPEDAREILDSGARRVIIGSALFRDRGADLDRAQAFASALGTDAFIAAVDSRGGRVVTGGWTRALEVTPQEAVAALEPFAGAFLYTHVDTEGLLTGPNLEAVRSVQAATRRRLIAAGGIRSRDDVDALDRLGIDAVVGMAIYRGMIDLQT